MTTKLEEKLAEREDCRSTLLSLRAELREKSQRAVALRDEARVAADRVVREQDRLVELTTECAKLLHADLAGIMPKSIPTGSGPAASVPPVVEPVPEPSEQPSA